MSDFNLKDLEAIIASRADASGEKSYTRSLMDKGVAKVAEKLGEEAIEAVIAAISQEKNEMVGEAADVLFHLLVLLKMREITLEEVFAELERRTGQSGLEEKASRG